ncbi:MAG: molybdate ABC transporter substrate-binding protein [Actinomycetota bacterium]|nr:molybdate ABC transporter substrate-binding protein [Actinomycetota bacterium]
MNREGKASLHKPSRQTKPSIKLLATGLAICCVLGIGCTSQETGLRVFAASSMTDFIQRIAKDQVTEQRGGELDVNIAGSGTLLAQLNEGAAADVVILAGTEYMERLQEMESFLPPLQFASTSLTVVVSPELAAANISMQDLKVGRLQGAACVSSAPCGQLAEEFAAITDLDLNSFTREPNVRSVLAKVERGEVDYGFVYRSDFLSTQTNIAEIKDSGAETFVTFYSLAVARDTPNMTQVESLLELISSPSGEEHLRQLGFEDP